MPTYNISAKRNEVHQNQNKAAMQAANSVASSWRPFAHNLRMNLLTEKVNM
jgi:hypothetical protein